MTFEKAFAELKSGKKICRKVWGKGDFIDETLDSADRKLAFIELFFEDWEIYEEKRETLTFPEAIEALKQGKCIRHESWIDDECINSLTSCVTVEDCISGKWEIYEEPKPEKTEMTAGHAIEVLESIRQVTSKSVIPEVDDAIDFAIETIDKLRHQKTEPEKKCECKCKQDIRKLAFDKFTDGMQCAFDIIEETRKDDKEEEKKELGCLFSPVLFFHDKEEEHIDKLEDVFKFMDWLYNSDYEFKPDDAAKIVGCYQGLKDYLYQQRKK